ncbi:unnamed protein product, partial [Polarella glacialis]
SGWHAHLWHTIGGLETVSMDSYSVRPVAWSEVKVVSDARTVADWGLDSSGPNSDVGKWALHLSWPPHSPDTVGLDLLQRWPGSFLVFIGERGLNGEAGDEGVTGGKSLLDAIDQGWEPLRTWALPRWPGYLDDMTLYRRRLRPRSDDMLPQPYRS